NRKSGQSWSIEATSLIDDGYSWRKYGQKEILNAEYPRNYYRCTHTNDQNCHATKQVQQISRNPTKYNIIYNGQHTCKNLRQTSTIIIEDSSLEENPSFLLTFDSNNNYLTPNYALNPSLFPSSTFHNNTTMVKQEHYLVKEESPLPHEKYTSLSTDNIIPSSSSDVTSIGLSSTPASEPSDVISPYEVYASTSTSYEMEEDFFLNIFDMDIDILAQLNELF
ncbi:putative WRKY transcription factor 70, partial [Bienertia sinuspersici]